MAIEPPVRPRPDRRWAILGVVLLVVVLGAVLTSWLLLRQPALHPVPVSSTSQG